MDFFQQVYAITKRIPQGRMATYGQIAAMISTPRAARVVGWALHALDNQPYPWQRVINSRGVISTTCETHTRERQKQMLESEGVVVETNGDEYRVDLKKYLWQPKIK